MVGDRVEKVGSISTGNTSHKHETNYKGIIYHPKQVPQLGVFVKLSVEFNSISANASLLMNKLTSKF